MLELNKEDIEFIKLMVFDFIKDLKELDSYDVTIGHDCGGNGIYSYLETERNVDGQWINNYSLSCLVESFEERIKREFDGEKLSKEAIDKMF